MQLADSHSLKELENRWLLERGHLVHQINHLVFTLFLILRSIILDLLIAYCKEDLLQGHILDGVALDAKLFEVSIDLSKDLMEVLRHVVAHFVDLSVSLVDMLRYRFECIFHL